MSANPTPVAEQTSPWEARRLRAEELLQRHPFAAELLTLYLALLPVQEEAWRTVHESAPPPQELASWGTARVLPRIVEVTANAGPGPLRDAVRSRWSAGEAATALPAWLAGDELDAVDTYLARAALAPALEALGQHARAATGEPAGADRGASCPSCSGRPQLSVVADSGDALVTGRRGLVCSRCATSWDYTRSACPACGESDENRLLVFAEQWAGPVLHQHGNGDAAPAVFPHLRVTGCKSCRRYVIEVDLARDARAVPEVDELAALPLDLYAADHGLTKVTPNLMGF